MAAYPALMASLNFYIRQANKRHHNSTSTSCFTTNQRFTMLRSRCASLRQLLRQSRLASGSCSWLSFTPIAARPLRPLSSRIFLPVVFESSRPFSVTPKVAAKRLEHFSKDLYEGIVEGTLEGILESLELLAETRPEVDVEYSVIPPFSSRI